MKLVTWNTQWCRGLDGVVAPSRIVEGARRLADFDVLCLQEIADGYPELPGSPGAQPQELAALLPGYQLFFGPGVDEFTRDTQGQPRRQRFGNLIATRLPVLQVQHHPLPWPGDGSVPGMPRACTVVTVQHEALGAVRIMTTHLEYYSPRQRIAQVAALAQLHNEACDRAAHPPLAGESGTPFQARPHTPHAILCGDFNAEPGSPEYSLIQSGRVQAEAPAPTHSDSTATNPNALRDAWPLAHGATPHAPTFRLFDHTYGPEPVTCDYFFVSASLSSRVRGVAVDQTTRASDHQPVLLTLG